MRFFMALYIPNIVKMGVCNFAVLFQPYTY